MKKTTIILTGMLIQIGFSSCNTWLDVRPENEIVLEDYWQTEAQANSVLASCYRGLAEGDCISKMIVWGEARSDNFTAGYYLGSGDLYNVINQNITPTNSLANWGSFYSVINYCNTYLHFAPDVVNRDPNFTISKLYSTEAEVLTLRALCYFYLVRAYKEVPLVLEPSISDQQNYEVAKSTERVILDTIISDLTKAQKYAKTDFNKGAYNKGRITLNAVNALLSDVYLWDQQYEKCVEACNSILSDNSLKLEKGADVLTNVFYTGNSTESIFELQFDNDNLPNTTVNSFYGVTSANNFAALSFPKFLAVQTSENKSPFNYTVSSNKESVSDLRAKQFFGTSTSNPIYPIYKYVLQSATINSDESVSPVYRSSSKTVNWIIYRLSDVILMKAEALVQLNRNSQDLQEAIKMVNTTYLRANTTADSLSYSNYSNQSAMEQLVMRERQRELLFEGKRWFDLVRYARRNDNAGPLIQFISPKMTGSSGLALSKMTVLNSLYMPVPKAQLEVNPKLTQNPFYLEDTSSN